VWHHVRTSNNPADVGSRSGEVTNHALRWNGPEWSSDKACWPPDIVTNPTQESLAEAKAKQDMVVVAVVVADKLDDLVEKFSQWRAIRVTCMDNPIHPEFSLQEDQEAGRTANRRRNEESRALLGKESAGTSYC